MVRTAEPATSADAAAGRAVESNRSYTESRRAAKVLDGVASGMRPSSTANQDATRAQLAACGAFDARPGLSAAALVLAAGLDDPVNMAHHPALGHRLSEILDKLQKGTAEPRRGGRLAAVQDMTRRPTSTRA